MAMSLKDRNAVGAAEFKARCLELIDHVHDGNVEYVVTRHGTPVAKLVPVGTHVTGSALGSMHGTVLRYDDPFDPVPAAWAIDRPEPIDPR
jgi:prevent-host-death family protein